MPTKIDIHLQADRYETIAHLTVQDKELLQSAQKACDGAYAPYSNFYVGAAIRLSDGEIILGNNQENAAYPSGLCAERTAIYWLGANRPGKTIDGIAIAARKAAGGPFLPITPCGACRQAVMEYEAKQKDGIRIIMQAEDGSVYVLPSVKTLLPFQFSMESLLLGE